MADHGATDRILWWYNRLVPGSRHLVVEWRSLSQFGDDPFNHVYVSFQVHLLEDGDRFQFQHGPSGSVGIPAALSASTGFENETGMAGLEYFLASPGLTLAQFPAFGTTITFTPVLCGDCNQNGVTSILDALAIAQSSSGLLASLSCSS